MIFLRSNFYPHKEDSLMRWIEWHFAHFKVETLPFETPRKINLFLKVEI